MTTSTSLLHDSQQLSTSRLMDDREQIRIFVSGRAKSVVKKFAERYDMTEQGVASRIYERFGAMPLPVQKWFVGLLEGNEGGGLQQFADMLVADNVGENPKPKVPARKGPKFDLDLIDDEGNPLDEEDDSERERGKPRGRGRKA